MKAYKLTDKLGQTKNNTQWGVGVTKTIGYSYSTAANLCTNSWFHFYSHPILGLIMNPAHGNFVHPKLWVGEASGTIKTEDGTKHGCTTLTIMEELTPPVITGEDVANFAKGVIDRVLPYDHPVKMFMVGAMSYTESDLRLSGKVNERSWLAAVHGAMGGFAAKNNWLIAVEQIGRAYPNIPFAKIIEATIPIR